MKKLLCILAACVLGLCALCACGESGASGKFYTVEEAYEQGFLSYEDVMSIAYYHNRGRRLNEEIMAEDYTPIPKSPKNLGLVTQMKIKKTAAYEYRRGTTTNAKASGFKITEYYGTYNGCIAVVMKDNYSGEAGVMPTPQEIAGIIFYDGGIKIRIWKKN